MLHDPCVTCHQHVQSADRVGDGVHSPVRHLFCPEPTREQEDSYWFAVNLAADAGRGK